MFHLAMMKENGHDDTENRFSIKEVDKLEKPWTVLSFKWFTFHLIKNWVNYNEISFLKYLPE